MDKLSIAFSLTPGLRRVSWTQNEVMEFSFVRTVRENWIVTRWKGWSLSPVQITIFKEIGLKKELEVKLFVLWIEKSEEEKNAMVVK